jgi:hypothetical protein
VAFLEATLPGGRAALRGVLDPGAHAYLMQSFDMLARFDALPLPCIAVASASLRGVSFDEQLRDANRHAEARAGSVYRGILRVLSAEMVALAVPRATAIVQLFGRTTARVVSDRRVQGVRRGVPRTLVRWTCVSSAYYLESALVRAGARDPNVVFGTPSVEGSVSGQPTYALPFEITWQR